MEVRKTDQNSTRGIHSNLDMIKPLSGSHVYKITSSVAGRKLVNSLITDCSTEMGAAELTKHLPRTSA